MRQPVQHQIRYADFPLPTVYRDLDYFRLADNPGATAWWLEKADTQSRMPAAVEPLISVTV